MTSVPVAGRVFITGALGLIGRSLAARYRRAGSTVTGVDRREDPDQGVVAGDIAEPGPWQDALRGADLVIHAAAEVGMRGDPTTSWRTGCLGTRHAIDAAVRCGVRRFVHFSSVAAFGFEYPDQVAENFPLRTNGVPYVDTKIVGEQIVLQAHAAGEIDCTILRPGEVYGAGSHYWTATPLRELAAGRVILPAMGRGQLSPIDLDDLVEGVLLAAGSADAVGEVFTLTGGQTVETRLFFGHYARMLGRPPVAVGSTFKALLAAATVGRLIGNPDISAAAVRYLARRGGYSIEKARSRLGYQPQVSLEEGMDRAEAWLRESGLLPGGRAR